MRNDGKVPSLIHERIVRVVTLMASAAWLTRKAGSGFVGNGIFFIPFRRLSNYLSYFLFTLTGKWVKFVPWTSY
jgi:hypothetical protein